jgi:quercetin dioxygenase-like cupin family protein
MDGISRILPSERKFTSQPWGWEDVFINELLRGYCMRKTFIKEGLATGMHMHPERDETVLVLDGKLMLQTVPRDFDPKTGSVHNVIPVLVHVGEAVRIDPKTWHRLFAVADVIVLTVSRYCESDDQETLDMDALLARATSSEILPRGLPESVVNSLDRVRKGDGRVG